MTEVAVAAAVADSLAVLRVVGASSPSAMTAHLQGKVRAKVDGEAAVVLVAAIVAANVAAAAATVAALRIAMPWPRVVKAVIGDAAKMVDVDMRRSQSSKFLGRSSSGPPRGSILTIMTPSQYRSRATM